MERLLSLMELQETITIFFFSSLLYWLMGMKKFLAKSIMHGERGFFSNGSRKIEEEMRLGGQEMKMVMEVMGMSYEEEVRERDLEGLFSLEPTMEEMKMVFSIFDVKLDGYIDAEEIYYVLPKLGFLEASSVERCRDMIAAYDLDNDGKIDFHEFSKLLETSFSCS